MVISKSGPTPIEFLQKTVLYLKLSFNFHSYYYSFFMLLLLTQEFSRGADVSHLQYQGRGNPRLSPRFQAAALPRGVCSIGQVVYCLNFCAFKTMCCVVWLG